MKYKEKTQKWQNHVFTKLNSMCIFLPLCAHRPLFLSLHSFVYLSPVNKWVKVEVWHCLVLEAETRTTTATITWKVKKSAFRLLVEPLCKDPLLLNPVHRFHFGVTVCLLNFKKGFMPHEIQVQVFGPFFKVCKSASGEKDGKSCEEVDFRKRLPKVRWWHPYAPVSAKAAPPHLLLCTAVRHRLLGYGPSTRLTLLEQLHQTAVIHNSLWLTRVFVCVLIWFGCCCRAWLSLLLEALTQTIHRCHTAQTFAAFSWSRGLGWCAWSYWGNLG